MMPLLLGLAALFFMAARKQGDSPGFEREINKIYRDTEKKTPGRPIPNAKPGARGSSMRLPLQGKPSSAHKQDLLAGRARVGGLAPKGANAFVEGVAGMGTSDEAQAIDEGLTMFRAVANDGGTLTQSVVGFVNQYIGKGGDNASIIKSVQEQLRVPRTGEFDATTKEAVALNVRRPR